jgi:hypothetical protein
MSIESKQTRCVEDGKRTARGGLLDQPSLRVELSEAKVSDGEGPCIGTVMKWWK